MKSIETIVPDIYEVLSAGVSEVSDEFKDRLGKQLANAVLSSLTRDYTPGLRMSNIGTPCDRKLYFKINEHDKAEDFPPEMYMKFLFGHVMEEIVLVLAELAGHSVEGRQDEQEIAGIKGHRDVVLDGVVTDVKSSSSYSFKKFSTHRLAEDDAFGYIEQLQSYVYSSQNDPLVTDKSKGAFLVVDKTLGHICLDVHQKEEFDWPNFYEYKKNMVQKDEPPAIPYEPVPEGKSGNMKLGTVCGYCEFKKLCYPEVRAFAYANKPIFLTTVVVEPKVPEIKGGTLEEVSD